MKKGLSLTAGVVLLIAVFSFISPGQRYFEIAKNLDIFASLFREVNNYYVDDVNPNELVRTGIDAMLNSLDPYTNYFPEDMVEDLRTMNTGQYGGIGAVTRQIGKRTVVTMIYEGYPAAKGGLKIGDEVIKMDNIELSKISVDEANKLMRGQVGNLVKLTVKRPGNDNMINLEFKREKIKVENVPYHSIMANNVGYLALNEFTMEAGMEVKNVVIGLKEKGAKSIILDLRGNPGGLVEEAVNICNIFLPKGKLVVNTRGKITESNVSYQTRSNPVDLEIPLVVLIDRGSASASEIVAGTFQDYDRAVIVGERSYGKGLVQLRRPLSYNSQVMITTSKYYTPSGRCIQVLDYSKRRSDGSVASVPDSLKKPFKTSKGRVVYDGGGIYPDVVIKKLERPEINNVMEQNGYLFDYATDFALRNPVIPPAKEFEFTDKEYNEFVLWVNHREYQYQTGLESYLNQISTLAKNEHVYNELKPQIEELNLKIQEIRKKDMILFKKQIKTMLVKEIVTRYYFNKGAIEAGFKYDEELKAAFEVLANKDQYQKVLRN